MSEALSVHSYLTAPVFSRTITAWQTPSAICSASRPGANPTAAAWASSWTAARRGFRLPKPTSSPTSTGAVPASRTIVTPRKESDTVQILSGTFDGKTLGTPICLWVKNEDARPEAYKEMKSKFRPSHADYTYFAKYGIRNWQGGGRASARETIGRVAAGAIAKKILRERFGVEILAYVKQVQHLVRGG